MHLAPRSTECTLKLCHAARRQHGGVTVPNGLAPPEVGPQLELDRKVSPCVQGGHVRICQLNHWVSRIAAARKRT